MRVECTFANSGSAGIIEPETLLGSTSMISDAANIREAIPDDTARISAIARAAYAKYVARIGREPAPMIADYVQPIAQRRCVVLEVGGKIMGYLVAWSEADAYFIENVAVDPECQGNGFGRGLLNHAAAEARRLGLPALRLYTNAMMVENLAMYRHMGFVETHRVTEDGYNRVYMLSRVNGWHGDGGKIA